MKSIHTQDYTHLIEKFCLARVLESFISMLMGGNWLRLCVLMLLSCTGTPRQLLQADTPDEDVVIVDDEGPLDLAPGLSIPTYTYQLNFAPGPSPALAPLTAPLPSPILVTVAGRKLQQVWGYSFSLIKISCMWVSSYEATLRESSVV